MNTFVQIAAKHGLITGTQIQTSPGLIVWVKASVAALHCGICSVDFLTAMRGSSFWGMPQHCWVYTAVAENRFDNLLSYFALLWFDLILFPSFCPFISHLQHAWQFLHGKYAPVFIVFLKSDYVFSAYLWWKLLSHSLLLCLFWFLSLSPLWLP